MHANGNSYRASDFGVFPHWILNLSANLSVGFCLCDVNWPLLGKWIAYGHIPVANHDCQANRGLISHNISHIASQVHYFMLFHAYPGVYAAARWKKSQAQGHVTWTNQSASPFTIKSCTIYQAVIIFVAGNPFVPSVSGRSRTWSEERHRCLPFYS